MKKGILTVLPFWSPLIPPKGLGALKVYVEKAGHTVFTFDLTNKIDLLDQYYKYFDCLKKVLPKYNLGNFYNVGHDLLANHMMAYMNSSDPEKLNKLVIMLVNDCYLHEISNEIVDELNQILIDYLLMLEKFILFQIKYEKPDIIGFTVYKTNIPSTIYILRSIKNKYPNIKTVIGGGAFADSHATSSPNFKVLCDLSEGIIDHIMIGQGEKFMLELFDGKLPANKRVLNANNDLCHTLSLDDVPNSDLGDFNIFKYAYLPVTASQGCPFKCSFCNQKLFYGGFETRNTEKCIDEMIELYKRYKKQIFFMTDSLLNPVINSMSEKMIERGLSFYYDSFFRVDKNACDVFYTTKWRKGGLYRVRLGLESGSDKILKLMDKKTDVQTIKSSLQALAFAGIKTTTYWIVGFPGETEEDFQQTLDFITANAENIYEAECNPFRYFVSNQNGADEWFKQKKKIFPDWANDMLKFIPYELNMEPNRKVTTERMFRFVEHCERLGIPNIYSTAETDLADKRWHKLHVNAVPAILDFDETKMINENMDIEQVFNIPDSIGLAEEINFEF